MKITTLLCLVSMLPISAAIYSQNASLSLKVNNTSIKEVLEQIEKESQFHFLYNDNFVDLEKKVDLNITKMEINELLGLLLEGSSSTYKVLNNNLIVIAPKEIIQQHKISGIVADASNGEPIIGANIVIEGTTIGVVTDAEGKFTLDINREEAILVISSLGYNSERVVLNGQSVLDIKMVPDIKSLEEVVVIGYGTVKKSDLTGSVSSIKTKDMEAVPVYNMEQALKTKAAGVQVTQNSGEPGGRIEVRIRGGNSMIGSNQPLYVVDGFAITGGMEFLNPSDIESIDILKDASATAIYGSRGANGVVIITSKKGIKGQKGHIEVNSYYGIQEETKRYKMLNSKQYAEVANEWLKNGGQSPYFNLSDVPNTSTDWQDLIYRKAQIQNHTITFSGSSESTRYSLSGNYYDQDGVIVNSGVKKGSLRLNLDHDLKKWAKLGVNVNLSRRQKNVLNVNNGFYGNNILSGALAAPPTLQPYDETGQLTRIESIYSFGSDDMRNPLIFTRNKDQYIHNSVLGNTTLEIKLADGLTFKTLVGIEYETYLREQFYPIIFGNDRGSASEGMSYRNSFLNENTFNYVKTFNGKHAINLVGGFTYQTDMSRYHSISVSGFSNNTTENYNLGAAETIGTPTSGISEWTLASWLGRANYTLSNKYIFTASIRADGSSRFGADHKWGYFPSGAFAWRVSEEPFMKGLEFVSDFKLRTSYGITGNTALSPYQSLDRMSSKKYIYTTQTDEIGFVPTGIANSDLKWETTAQTDLGFDLNFISNRLRFTFDYYQKNTSDLLASVPLPSSVGFSSILQNIGEIRNKGIELTAQADILDGNFKWNVAANVSSNKNEVMKLAGGSDIYGSSIGNPFYTNINVAREGEPFGMFYGLVEDGLDEKGYIKYKDLHEDGVINTLDRVIIGNPYPDFIYGLNQNFSFKNFDLSIFLEGVQGNDIFWATAGSHLNSFQRGTNQFADLYGNYWTAENPDPHAKYPKISSGTSVTVSDRFIEDGSYLRVKSLKLTYNIPSKKIGMPWLENAQIYISGTNLFTFTNYPGLDPEVSTRGTEDSSVGSRLQMGIDESAYPNAKTYAVGIKLNF